MAKKKIQVEGLEIRIRDDNNYICITDIARKVDDRTDIVISNWLRNASTLDFLYEWELMFNPKNFKPIEFDGIRKQAGKVGFVMTAKKWIEGTGAVGIQSKAGRYGGTFAHRDIAYEFCTAVSASFKLSLIRGFDLLIEERHNRLGQPFDVSRLMASSTFPILTEGIREAIPSKAKGTKKEGIYFASEVDMLNTILFGLTAKEWRKQNSKLPASKNMRDYASTPDLLILSALQALNERLIKWKCDKAQRFELLTEAANDWKEILSNRKSIKELSKRIDKQRKLK